MTVEEKLEALGLQLPEPLSPIGNDVGAVRTSSLLFLSGHGPRSLPTNIPVEIEMVFEIGE